MRQFFSQALLSRALLVAWSAIWIASAALTAEAVEDAQEFVEAMRQRGMHEMAMAYLDRAANDPFVSDEFKGRIAYEQGVTSLHQARVLEDPEIRKRTLDQAYEKLSAFAEANPESLLGAKAQNHLGNMLVERGRALVAESDGLAATQAGENKALAEQAQQIFDEARVVFDATSKFYVMELKRLPVIAQTNGAGKDVETSRRGRSAAAEARLQQQKLARTRQRLRSELVQSRMLAATVLYEKASAYPADGEARKELLNEAAEKYADLFDKYHRWMAGLYARLWQGRCYRDLEELDKAIGCFEDLIIQDSRVPAFRTLISKAHQAQAECYLRQGKYDEVIAKCGHWIEQAHGADARDPDWLGVKFQLAVAHQKKGAAVEKSERREHESKARSLLRDVSRWPSDWRGEARQRLVSLGAGSGEETANETEPTTFDESFAAGREAVETMGSLQLAVKLARANNPDEVPAMEREIVEQREAAFRYFQQSVQMAEETGEVGASDAKNRVAAHSYLAYLNYEIGRYFDAAVLGEFVARNHPQSAGGRRAAQVAIAAYQQLYFAPDNEDRDFELRQITSIAKYVIDEWPETKQAATALRILIDFALRAGDLDAARIYVARIEPERRSTSLFRIGIAEWAQYVGAARREENQRPVQAELDAMKTRAQASLEEGIGRLQPGAKITPEVATAALYLAQIYLDTLQYEKAIAQLEGERFGPLTLVAAGHPAAKDGLFVEEVIKAALRAYVSVQPMEREKALQIMDAMEKRVAEGGDAGDSDAGERITKIYISLGRKLQTQLERLMAEGNVEEVRRVSAAFVEFLDRAGHREKGNTWASRNWVAQTYYNLAAGRADRGTAHGKKSLSDPSRAFYDKSAEAYQKLLDEAAADPSFAPNEEAILGAKVRLAECLRRLKRYKESLDLFAGVLADRPNVLAMQVAAAETYQERGAEEDPKWYQFARNGGRKDKATGTNRIWGWKRVAQVAYRYPKYRQTYFEAQYNNSLCRFKYAMQQSEDRRNDLLAKVQRELRSMDLLWTGESWKPWRGKYERLLKDVQRGRHSEAVGFAAG